MEKTLFRIPETVVAHQTTVMTQKINITLERAGCGKRVAKIDTPTLTRPTW
jgi:hypothetical protein